MTTDPIPRTVVERLRCGLFQPKRPILDFKYNPLLCVDDGSTVGMFKYQRLTVPRCVIRAGVACRTKPNWGGS